MSRWSLMWPLVQTVYLFLLSAGDRIPCFFPSTCLCAALSEQPAETSQPCRETKTTLTSTLTCRNYSSSSKTSRNRPCVRCVWTGWRTWSSCAATAPASCVGTEWASAPSAARPSSAASSSTRHPPQTLSFSLFLLLNPTPTTPANKATITPPAAAAPAPPSSQHPSQPAKGVL